MTEEDRTQRKIFSFKQGKNASHKSSLDEQVQKLVEQIYEAHAPSQQSKVKEKMNSFIQNRKLTLVFILGIT